MKNPLDPNLIRIPENLESITQIDHDSEIDPLDVGIKKAEIDRLWHSVEKLYKSRTQPAISIAVRHKGQLVMNRAIGHARGNGPKEQGATPVLMKTDTPICLFSASKAVTATLIHKLAEEGLIRLHDPVAEYIPEFAAKGKQYITVGHVLSHKSGIPTIKQKVPDPSLLWNWDAVIDVLCKAKPRADAGQKQAYHAITGGFILGEIMRRVTGDSLRDIMDERIRKPLGARYLNFGLPEDQQSEAAMNYFTGRPEVFPFSLIAKRALGGSFAMVSEISNSPEFMSSVIPAGNIYATALEACNYFQCLLDGGTWQGQRVFQRATVARAISEASPRQFDRTLMAPIRASEGFMLGDYPFGMYGPRTRESFGHLGFISIFCWADPVRDMSVALLNTGKPVIAGHIPPLIGFLRTINSIFPRYDG